MIPYGILYGLGAGDYAGGMDMDSLDSELQGKLFNVSALSYVYSVSLNSGHNYITG
jgi:hypothetical protein